MKLSSHIKRSFYDRNFYVEGQTVSRKSLLVFLFKLVALYGLVIAALTCIIVVPRINAVLSDESISKISAVFPAELTIKIKDGIASTNVKEPYAIPFPKGLRTIPGLGDEKSIANLLVIDTWLPVSTDRFVEHRTLLMLTKEFLLAPKGHMHGIVTQPLKSFHDALIDRAFFVHVLETIREHEKELDLVVVLVYVIREVLIGTVSFILLALIIGLLLYIYRRSQKMPLSYRGLLKTTLFSAPVFFSIKAAGFVLAALSTFNLPTYVIGVILLLFIGRMVYRRQYML